MKMFSLDFELDKRHAITFLTGAGISSESGIPTFRGEKGLWEEVDVKKFATPQGFESDPRKAWEWYDMRRVQAKEFKPNKAHYVIAALENAGYDVVVITQNIDNFHFEAGSNNVIELHGNIWKVRCTRNCGVWVDRTTPFPALPPVCACGSILRPHVVWFGEMLDEQIIGAAYARLLNTDLCVVVGTSGVVHPAAGMAAMAKENGAHVLEVNLEETPISYVADKCCFGKAGEVLPALFGRLIGEK